MFILPRIRIFNANATVLFSLQLSKNWMWYSTNTKHKPWTCKIYHISLILYVFITIWFEFLMRFQRFYFRRNWIKTDDAIPWIPKSTKSIKSFRIWKASQKGSVILYAPLASIPSRPPMAAERVEQIIIIIVDHKYVFLPLEIPAKRVQQQVGIHTINSGDVYIYLHFRN